MVLTSFDVLLITAALMTMLVGVCGNLRPVWLAGRGGERKSDWAGLVRYLVRQEPILKRPHAGICHLFLFWGFVVFLVVSVLAQFNITLAPIPAAVVSGILELLGVLMFSGTLFFLVRRFMARDDGAPKRTVLPMAILLIIIVSGFLAQAARLRIMEPGFNLITPIGSVLSGATPDSPLFMQIMIRIHFFAVLLFFAILPFTAMRHLVVASANVLYRKRTARGTPEPLPLDAATYGAGTARDLSWKEMLDAEACVSCGRCEENCPAFLSGKALSPRKIMQGIFRQMAAVSNGDGKGDESPSALLQSVASGNEIWDCTMCIACVQQCPVFAEPVTEILEMRRYRVMQQGLLPVEARPALRDLSLYGDVQGKGVSHRKDWALNRDVPVISENASDLEVLFWVGCSGAFHPRNQETARAMAKILNASGVRYAILGSRERCCGDPARRLGDEALFLDLARENIRWLNEFGIKKIVTLCPHCLQTLKNEYPSLGGQFEVVHAAEFVSGLLRQGKIALKYPNARKIAIQDPCYLGRYNQVYEALREICGAVPGMVVKELGRNRENSFCCGGGGGRMWLHENTGVGINKMRAEEALKTGLDMLGTACPYCLTMLEDGIKSSEAEHQPKVADIIDIVADSIELRVNGKSPCDGEE